MGVRIDTWLWAVRVFRTRSEAAEACQNGRVTCGGGGVKPSHEVRPGETFVVRKSAVYYHYKVLAEVGNRQPAKLVPEYALNVTPQSELDKLNAPRETIFMVRERGTGRPTKKERRQIDSLLDEFYYDADDE